MEIWKDIKGYEGLYQVSNQGRVKSLERYKIGRFGIKYRVNEKIIIPHQDKYGYIRVGIYKDGVERTIRIHKLVAEVFIPNPNNYTEINHIDEDKTNNRVENLEWCSRSYNVRYGSRLDKVSKALQGHYNTKCSKSVLCVELNRKFPSSMEAERWLGIHKAHSNICKCCIGKPKYKTAYGYHWRYIEEEVA